MIPGRIDKGRRLGNLSDILEFLELSTFQSGEDLWKQKTRLGYLFQPYSSTKFTYRYLWEELSLF